MELIKSAGRKTRFSELAYLGFTILLPLALFGLIRAFEGAPFVALALVLVSKWRIFAVRPRFWLINIKTNLVDVIVSVSYVLLLAATQSSIATQIALTVLFMLWLLVLKPRSRRLFMALQSLTALVIGLTTLFMYSHYLETFSVTVLAWLIGYASARHIISAYEEENIEAIAAVWGLVVAEVAWVSFHWTLAYPLYGGIAVPQVAALMGVIGFAAYHYYDHWKRHDENTSDKRLGWTLGICGVLIAVILFVSRWDASL